jgi:hypothetical protein
LTPRLGRVLRVPAPDGNNRGSGSGPARFGGAVSGLRVWARSARKVLPVDPAAGIALRTGRVKPPLWTDERIERYAETGIKPGPVMVWTQSQAGRFLDAAADDRLYPLWAHGGVLGSTPR